MEAPATTQRVITAAGGVAIVAGSMLGIGIFLSPSVVAQHVNSVGLFIAIWALGGLTALAGAVACGELGAMLPKAGGDYVFQYEAYGPSVAFASGWVLFAAIFCGSIAAVSVGVFQYQAAALTGIPMEAEAFRLPWGPVSRGQIGALLLVVVVSAYNAIGARLSSRVQEALAYLPIVLLAVFSCYGIVVGGALESASTTPVVVDAAGLVTAYMAVYFAYSGWINVIYVAGEVENPGREIPRALIWGTLLITALYLLLCGGFVRVLGLEQLRQVGEAGTATAAALIGEWGRIGITVLIAAALVATVNATVLGGARVAYAMAKQGAIWSALAEVDPVHHVPKRAIYLQGFISCLLILSGRFNELLSLVGLAMVLTGSLTVGSVFVLRRKMPDAVRPYLASGYPWLPGIYLVSSAFVLVVMIREATTGKPGAWYPLAGLVVLILAYVGHKSVNQLRPQKIVTSEDAPS
jgi:APA family basic amino acid/polyamine antiporter